MQKEYFNMKEEASPSPSEGGDVFPKALLSFEKKPHHQPIYGLPKPLRRRGCVPPNASFYRKEASLLSPTTASPPTPLRMERGVKTIICR